MRKIFTVLMVLVFALKLEGQVTIHCWDFDGSTSPNGEFTNSPIDVSNRVSGNGSILHNFTEVQDFNGNSSNACSGSGSGAAFCPIVGSGDVNNGNSVVFVFPTTGYESIILSFWARRTSTGFNNNSVEYSTNGGSSYNPFATYNPSSSSSGSIQSFDFSSISAANNNSSFQIRITLDGGSSTAGNNRFDNIKLEGDIILPISLSSFTAKAQTNNILLHWQTATEINNDYMAVERSRDGRHFEEIGVVQGMGTTTEAQDYEFIDRSPMRGMNFYRLRQVDFDGQYEYHKVVSVEFGDDEAVGEFQVYPTLVTDFLTVEWIGEVQEDVTFQVVGMDGRIWRKPHHLSEGRLDIGTLPSGIYLLQLCTLNGVYSRRFIKE